MLTFVVANTIVSVAWLDISWIEVARHLALQ
jgi:hypothetical protein